MNAPKHHYLPGHTVTANYHAGMCAVDEERLQDAYQLLIAEPQDSSCYGLARGNAVLVLRRLDKYQEAERLALETLEHLEQHGCPHPPSWVQFARNHAEALVGQGRYAESLPFFYQVGELADKLAAKHLDFAEEIELEKAHACSSWGSSLLCLDSVEDALDLFQTARDIYRKYEASNRIGRAEALTNYANALRIAAQNTAAELALREALEIAQADGNLDQVRRTQLALIQLGSSLVSQADAHAVLDAAAAAAETEQRYSTAFIRHCIHAEYASSIGDSETGLEVVGQARRLEIHLDENDPNPAKLRMTQWKLLEQIGASEEDLLSVLLEGADLWFRRIGKPLVPGDIAAMAVSMHEHFRILTRSLARLKRYEEAVTAFEAGRALSHSVEVDPLYFDRVVAVNPFRVAGKVSLELLESARNSLTADEVLVVLTVLPPALVSFIISKTDVQTLDVLMPEDPTELEQLFNSIRMIPTRLEARVGSRAIPPKLFQLANGISEIVGSRAVAGLLPYSALHDVPWRALLHDVGLPWSRLSCSVEFGLFLRTMDEVDKADGAGSPTCVALGYGAAGEGPLSVDLTDEARDFAAAFGPNGRVVEVCKSADVMAALCTRGVVVLSCHGAVRDRDSDGRLVLELADGRKLARGVLPEVASADIVILSACESGVYGMVWGDFPVGAAPDLLRAGVRYCVGARFRIGAQFAARFFHEVSLKLAAGTTVSVAIAESSQQLEAHGADLWSDLACVELFGSS